MFTLRKTILIVLVATGALQQGAAVWAGDADARIKFEQKSWTTGFSGTITIGNLPEGEGQALKDWQVTFDFPGTITGPWGCVMRQEGTHFTLGPVVTPYDNSIISPGEKLPMGFGGSPCDPYPANLKVSGTWIPPDKPPYVPLPKDYRINADRDAATFTLGTDEPLLVHVKQGETRTFTFNDANDNKEYVRKVISRNPTVADIIVEDGAIKVTGKSPGRTGMRIYFEDVWTDNLYLGLRVDHADGSLPGLPGPVALGSVSQDIPAHLNFWINHVPGEKGTRVDLRYVYLEHGPISGWAQITPDLVTNYAKESLVLGLVPFFVFYNIPNDNEDYDIDLQNIRNKDYMTAYYQNLQKFLTDTRKVMKGELYGAVLEPDFLGYMQSKSGLQPDKITTADGTLVSTVTKINQTIADRKDNILFGWQINLWADPKITYNQGVIRITDKEGWGPGREIIKSAATNTAKYVMDAGVLSHGANFIAIDKYGMDGGSVSPNDPSKSAYFWNSDHWHNYLLFVRTVNQVSGKPMVLWQLPVGRINSSTTLSARTKEYFPDLPNTTKYYEDSCTTFFFGDSFNVPNQTREDYFSQNQAVDQDLKNDSGRLTWGSHMSLLPGKGIIAALFGAGIGESTTNLGYPPTDDYFWIQKAQTYYEQIEGPAYPPAQRQVPILYLLLD